MSTLIQWQPVKELEELHHRLSGYFGRSQARSSNGKEEGITLPDWIPLADISEDEKEYVIKVELLDVPKEDVHVTIENGVLTIAGTRKFEREEKGKKYHRVERGYGSFARSFTVPDDADPSGVKAEFKDGALTVRLPKNENAKPRQIEVAVA